MDDGEFKAKEAELLHEISALYTKLNQVREKRAKAEQNVSSSCWFNNGDEATSASLGNRKRRRLLLVTRSLPFKLISEDIHSQWRAEFPEHITLDSALETFLSLHELYDCVWIGSVHGEIEPSEQNTLKDQLLSDRNYFPVFLDPKRESLFYQGFCKSIMWPLFHSCPPTTEDQLQSAEFDSGDVAMTGTSGPGGATGANDEVVFASGTDHNNVEKMWQAYVAVNQAFADAVQEIYEEGDLIWIQGYHLTLLPQMVQNLFPNDNIPIGFFMHIPFPSSELYRIMNNREEILTGMLGADLIGFQTYEYARHFQSAAVRLLGLESSHKGVDFNGHFARVTICPVGIDAEKISSLARSDAVQERIHSLQNQFLHKKVILGVDQLDLTKGLVHKLLAVEELFTLQPELSKEVVFLQIVTDHPGNGGSALGAQVEALVSRINSKLQDLGAEGPVQYLNQEIGMETLIALYCLADILVVTPVRDGMNTIPFEYVVCREASGNHARVVLSEFAGCAQALGGAGAIQVNPWNTEELQDALLHSLHDNDEVMQIHQHMYSYVSTFTVRHWADNFIEQLRESSEENMMVMSSRELSRRDMTSAYLRSHRRLIFINYEGVLAAESSIPELSFPPQELLWQLSMLTKDMRNTVVLVSARSTSVCEQWFASLVGNVVLAAEYGVYVKWLGEEEKWRCMVPNLDLSWWEHVVPLLEYYTERTPGAFIERKDSSVAWHYRDCDLDHGLWQASELLVSLREITRSMPVAVVPGNRYLEVRPKKVSKAFLFERIWEFMNFQSMCPEEKPLTTDYFGDIACALVTSPTCGRHVMKPVAMSLLKDPNDMVAALEKRVRERRASYSLVEEEQEAIEKVAFALEAEEMLPVDFVLVIASGDDRTDEDLFGVLVPPPIDLEAYCRQLEKEEELSNADESFNYGGGPGIDHLMEPLRESMINGDGLQLVDESLPSVHLSPTGIRRIVRRESGSSTTGLLGLASTSNQVSAGTSVSAPNSTSNTIPTTNESALGLQGPPVATLSSSLPPQPPPQLTRIPSPTTEADFFLLSEGITNLNPLYNHTGTKSSISQDAANMFPRTLLSNAPTNARREEITEKSKFTPRRDFPPSAALFKAMKNKYGETFGMQKIPDTPAACWALVCPPQTRAKLEDGSLPPVGAGDPPAKNPTHEDANATNSAGESSGCDLFTTGTAESEASSCMSPRSVNEVGEAVHPSSSPDDQSEHLMIRSNSSSLGSSVGSPLTPPSNQQQQSMIDENPSNGGLSSNVAESSNYRLPVNTFVCTLGRKLSQAPYYIKNSADLFQLLQEMGLSSHLRHQRFLSSSD